MLNRDYAALGQLAKKRNMPINVLARVAILQFLSMEPVGEK
jgi:hypothetical protein